MASTSTINLAHVVAEPVRVSPGDGKEHRLDPSSLQMSDSSSEASAVKSVDIVATSGNHGGVGNNKLIYSPITQDKNIMSQIPVFNRRVSMELGGGGPSVDGNGEDTNRSEEHEIIRKIRVKKKKASRASLNAFFRQAASVSAAKQQERPKTRHGGRREGTNHYGIGGAVLNPKPDEPHAAINPQHGSNSSASSQTEISGAKRKGSGEKGKRISEAASVPQAKKVKQALSLTSPESVVDGQSKTRVTTPKISLVMTGRNSSSASHHAKGLSKVKTSLTASAKPKGGLKALPYPYCIITAAHLQPK